MAGIVVARRGFLKCMSSIVLPTCIPARVIQDIINGADPGRYVIPIERLVNARIGPGQDFTCISAWMKALNERWRELPSGTCNARCFAEHVDDIPAPFTRFGSSWMCASDKLPSKVFVYGDTAQVFKFDRRVADKDLPAQTVIVQHPRLRAPR